MCVYVCMRACVRVQKTDREERIETKYVRARQDKQERKESVGWLCVCVCVKETEREKRE